MTGMTFAKHAANALYPVPEEPVPQEEQDESSNEWLKWAIASGLLVGGGALLYANRDAIAKALKGRAFDSRNPFDRAMEDTIGVGPATLGGAIGVASAGPWPALRRSRLLHGDMAGYSHLPGLGTELIKGDTAEQHVKTMQDLVGRGLPEWSEGGKGKPTPVTPTERARRIGDALIAASAPGGENRFMALMNRADPYEGIRVGAATAEEGVRGVRGNRLYNPNADTFGGWLKARTTHLRTPRTQTNLVLQNLDRVGADAEAARAVMAQGGTLSPDERRALMLEGMIGRELRMAPDMFDPETGFLRDSLQLRGIAPALHSAQNVGADGWGGRALRRGVSGLLAGAGTSALASTFTGD